MHSQTAADAYRNRAQAHYLAHEYDQALVDHSAAIERVPELALLADARFLGTPPP